jgi:hypothetical protein
VPANGSEIRTPPKTAKGDKMQLTASVEAFQRLTYDFHRKETPKSAPLQMKGCSTQAQHPLRLVAE